MVKMPQILHFLEMQFLTKTKFMDNFRTAHDLKETTSVLPIAITPLAQVDEHKPDDNCGIAGKTILKQCTLKNELLLR